MSYVDGTNGTVNSACSKLTPCTSLNTALALLPKYIHVSNTVNELVTVPLDTVKTIIGDRGTSTLADQSNPITSKLTASSVGTLVTLTNSTSMDVTFIDIAFAGTTANADAIAASAPNTAGVKLTLERCLVDGVGFEGIDMSKGTLALDRTTVSNNALGGIQLSNTNYTITNSYITHNNTAGTSSFGGIGITGGSGSISFATVAGNLGASGVFGISCVGVTNGTVANTIVSANAMPQIDTGCTYSYSGIPGGTGTNLAIETYPPEPRRQVPSQQWFADDRQGELDDREDRLGRRCSPIRQRSRHRRRRTQQLIRLQRLMRCALLSLALVASSATAARADDDVIGVVVIGDTTLQPRVTAYLEHWLAEHHHSVLAAPLSTDAINTITSCLLVDDSKCARGVVDARSKADVVLFTRAEIDKNKNVVINAFWFSKGHEAIGERRVCEKCIGENWHNAADQMMDALTSQTFGKGHLHVESQPSGDDRAVRQRRDRAHPTRPRCTGRPPSGRPHA